MNLMIGLAAVDQVTGGKQTKQLAAGWMGRESGRRQSPGTARRTDRARQSRRTVAAVILGLGLLTGVAVGRAGAQAPSADGGTGSGGSIAWAISDGTRPGFLLEDPSANLTATHGTGPADEYTQAADGNGTVGSAPAHPTEASVTPEYRWDFPAVTTAFVADQFTYREDHRASAGAGVSGFLPGSKGLWIYA